MYDKKAKQNLTKKTPLNKQVNKSVSNPSFTRSSIIFLPENPGFQRKRKERQKQTNKQKIYQNKHQTPKQ